MNTFLAFSLNAFSLVTLPVQLDDPWSQKLLASDASTRFQAFSEIERLGPKAKAAIPALIVIASGDPSIFFRRRAFVGLSLMGPEAAPAIPLLIAALKDPDKGTPGESGIPIIAICALGNIGSPAAPAVPALLEVVKKPKLKYMEHAAIAVLGKIGVADKEVLTVLQQALQDQNKKALRGQAAYAVGYLGPTRLGMHAQKFLPLLLDLLQLKGNIDGADVDGIESTRCAAAWALGQMPDHADTKIVLAFAAILHEQEATPAVRNAVLRALTTLGPKRAKVALPTLVKVLQSNLFASATIEKAVFSMGPAAIPHLIKLLKEESPLDRRAYPLGRIAALKLLGRLGPQMQDATEAINQVIREEADNLRAPAAYEVLRIAKKTLKSIK